MPETSFLFPAMHAEDPETLGDFRLVARLGEGGMGQVFLALSPGGLPTAVKAIRPEFAQDAQFTQRFTQEVRTAQKVRGAHIAPLLDADPTAERPWLATAYVAGPSLQDLIATQGPLPTGQVMLLAFGIAHALADIHAADVVHRDLKPANIMLDETGVKVIDFGIVKSMAQSVTYRSHSTRIGTPLFMSPEQAMGRTIGPASDMFALGSILYSLATASEAFAAENEWGVAHRIVADHPDLSGLDSPLSGLITACLDKDPEQRPTPQQVKAWCEQELGDALGPGAWMGITGARESIQRRTAALRTIGLQGPGTPDTAPREDSEEKDTQVRSSTPLKPTLIPLVADTKDTPAPPVDGLGGLIALHMTLTLMAAGVFLWATFLPLFSLRWTDKSSGDEVANLTLHFSWHNTFKPQIPIGISGLDEGEWVIGVLLVIVTAIGLVACALSPLTLSKGVDARFVGRIAFKVCFFSILSLWVFIILQIMKMIFGWGNDTADQRYELHPEVLSGGWLLILANSLILCALWRTYKRAGLDFF